MARVRTCSRTRMQDHVPCCFKALPCAETSAWIMSPIASDAYLLIPMLATLFLASDTLIHSWSTVYLQSVWRCTTLLVRHITLVLASTPRLPEYHRAPRHVAVLVGRPCRTVCHTAGRALERIVDSAISVLLLFVVCRGLLTRFFSKAHNSDQCGRSRTDVRRRRAYAKSQATVNSILLL